MGAQNTEAGERRRVSCSRPQFTPQLALVPHKELLSHVQLTKCVINQPSALKPASLVVVELEEALQQVKSGAIGLVLHLTTVSDKENGLSLAINRAPLRKPIASDQHAQVRGSPIVHRALRVKRRRGLPFSLYWRYHGR